MHSVVGILLGTICSGGGSLCLGACVFRRLNLRFERIEHLGLALVVGAACFSQIVFFLCSLGVARRNAFLAIALLSAIFAVSGGINTWTGIKRIPLRWRCLFGVLFLSFGTVYLVNAMAPEMSPDGSAYQIPIVTRYLEAHGFENETQNLYACLSHGIGLLFLPALSLGGHSAASMVHFLFLLDLPLMMISYGRRFGFPLPATAAAFIVFASPIFGWDGTSAYVDVASAGIVFALYYLLQIWDAERDPSLLIPIGILAGFSYAAKYSAAIAIPYALGFITWKLCRYRKPLLRPLFTIFALTAFFVLPWMIKNAMFVHNPLAPFANQLFPNSYVHVSFEEQYRFDLRHYTLTSWLSAPWELAVKGERLQGFLGPVFLLLPLALCSLCRREGRRLLLASAIFVLPWFANMGTRFLMPALPLLALALALALRYPAPLLVAIAILHGVLSWYATPFHSFDSYAPRLATFPLRAALRLEPEEAYLERYSSGYRIDRMIEREVPLGERVFAFEQIAEAWTTRQILVSYTAADNEVLADILRTPLDPRSFPEGGWAFRFDSQPLRRLRVVQTAEAKGEMWSASEFQVFDQGSRLPPEGSWRLNAEPNPWGVSLAFDGNPVTRWRSWRESASGMYIDVDFSTAKVIDEVRLLTAPDSHRARMELLGMDVSGRWRTLTAHPSEIVPGVTSDLRRAAIQALLSRGVRFLLVSPGAFAANDFRDHPGAWGIRPVGATDGTRLYRLTGSGDEMLSSSPEADAPPAAVPPGVYDDFAPQIRLRAAWTADTQFLEADRHTLTYSNIPGATASLAFYGSAVTYVYTCAFNRGIVDVLVDGLLKDRIDPYSADTRWKSRARYDGLGSGVHTIQIRVTGQRNPKAADCFADLDSFIVE